MKISRKIISAIALSSVIWTMSIPAVVSAEQVEMNTVNTTVNLGDINEDEAISLTDIVLATQFLSGGRVATAKQITAMDVNQDYVIDSADVDLIQVMDANGSSPIAVNKALYTVPNNTDMWYYKHICSSTSPSSYTQYKISAATIDLCSVGDSIMNNDYPNMPDYPDYENCNVVKITSSLTGQFIGSGTIVGDHVIATAAHVVYSSPNFRSNLNVQICSENSNQVIATIPAVTIHIPKKYTTESSGAKDNYDYALIYVDQDLSSYGVWSLGMPVLEFSDSEENVAVSGFKYDSNYNQVRYYSTGVIQNFVYLTNNSSNDVNMRLRSNAASYPGKSGGAMYYTPIINPNSRKSLIGVITGGVTETGTVTETYSWADKMTPNLVRFYKLNSNL